MNRRLLYAALVFYAVLTGCESTAPDVTGSASQLEARQIQTRDYDTLDRKMTIRSVVATLQDLGFTIDTADSTLGTITGTRIYYQDKYKHYTMRMTVTVQDKDGDRITVRANARLDEEAISEPVTYQDFFAALDKAMFLTSQKVD